MLSTTKKEVLDTYEKIKKIAKSVSDKFYAKPFHDGVDSYFNGDVSFDVVAKTNGILEKIFEEKAVVQNFFNSNMDAYDTKEAVLILYTISDEKLVDILYEVEKLIKSYNYENADEIVRKIRNLEKEAIQYKKIFDKLYTIVVEPMKTNARVFRDERIAERKRNMEERINRKMDTTHGLTHIHASKHPLSLHGAKTTKRTAPRRKNSIEQLENSVRRMF